MATKVLIYENGLLTVTRDYRSAVRIPAEKPNFIIGDTFYYSSEKKSIVEDWNNTAELTECEINAAEEFINSYVFAPIVTIPTTMPVSDIKELVLVDSKGAYKGTSFANPGLIVVPLLPKDPNKCYWDFETNNWIEGYTIVTETGMLVGKTILIGETYSYIPASLVDENLCSMCQVYDAVLKRVVIDITKYKMKAYKTVSEAMSKTIDAHLDKPGKYEVVSFFVQVAEAKSYLTFKDFPTPYLSTLLARRKRMIGDRPETMDDLVDKIIKKSIPFEIFHAGVLGEYHRLKDLIDNAETVEEIDAITETMDFLENKE